MKSTEADTRVNYIDPTLQEQWTDKRGWILREYYFTYDRELIGNKRRERCFAGYLLRYKNINLAITETKAFHKSPTGGLQHVIDIWSKTTRRTN